MPDATAAARQRLHRRREREGRWVVQIEIWRDLIDALESAAPGRSGNASPGRGPGPPAVTREKVEVEFTEGLFAPYRPQRLSIEGAHPHPTKLV